MKLISNIILKWHRTLSDSIRTAYTSPKVYGIKPHSVFTVLAALSTNLFPFMMKSMAFQNKYLIVFSIIYKTVCILMITGLYIYALYCWKVFLNLRSDNIIKDKNLFFSESAGLYRKVLFYLALVSHFILKLRSHPDFDGIRHQLRADFYREAGITILESVIFSILIIELSRILFAKTFPWNNRTHYAVVIMSAIIMSGLRVAALNFASGHGII